MVQATDFREDDDPALSWSLHSAWRGRVFRSREMRADLVVVGDIPGQGAPQMCFVEHDEVIETLATQRTDQALRIGVLPGAAWTRDHLRNVHVGHAALKHLAVDRVAISQQPSGSAVVRKASTTCWAAHSAVGWSVTAQCTIRRRA